MFKIKHLLLILSIFILTSCIKISSISPSQKNNENTINVVNKTIHKLKLGKKGKYLFGILIDKKNGKFIKKIKPNETYNLNRYELIKVYEDNFVYPSYEPSNISNHKDSIFRDKTFDELGNVSHGGIKGKVVFSTKFDKEKFLEIAKNTIKKLYQNIQLSVKMRANKQVNEEYPIVILEIKHRPQINFQKIKFKINGSSIYSKNKPKITNISPILQKRIYRLNIPTGKNKVEVFVSSLNGEKARDKTHIENKFRAKPTLHILAIGINEFPNWAKNKYLKNAINDAEYVQKVLKDKSEKLFSKGGIFIKPYFLNVSQTTKNNIEKLIEDIRLKVKPNDYFLFYVASHGIIHEDKYYFATSDYSSRTYRSNHINEKQISEYLITIPTIFRIAILDTCNAGKQVEVVKNDIQNLPFAKREGISVLSSAKNGQIANDSYKNTRHGLFAWILVEGLNGKADVDGDLKVDSMEIVEYVKNNVGKISRQISSDKRLFQDAVVLPEPNAIHRRFDLTYLKQKNYRGSFYPNIFTPRESQLYINAINNKNSSMMRGIKRNNRRHREGIKSISLNNNLTISNVIKAFTTSDSIDINILFNTNSSVISGKEFNKLKVIAQALNSNKLRNKKIIVEGHTDSKGSESFNFKLSQQRANSVSEVLSNRLKVNPNRILSIGFGEMYPIASNLTESGRRKNRRVSIFIYD